MIDALLRKNAAHAEAGLQSMLASEVARLKGELQVLEQRLQASEADVDKLMGMSDLGHTNSKQKIQYFVRYALSAWQIRTSWLKHRHIGICWSTQLSSAMAKIMAGSATSWQGS